LQHNKPYQSFSEEGQWRPCHFWWAYVKDGVLNTDHGPVLCRDFLGDTLVWKRKEEVPAGAIYSWDYKGKVETKFTSLVIDNFGEILHNIVTILNPIEEKIKVKLTTAEITDDGKHVHIRGDKFWMLTTVHFSWYTTLLRYLTWDVKFSNFDELYDKPTNGWSKQSFPQFKALPYVLKQLKVTQVAGVKLPCDDKYTMHDYNGWYSNTNEHKRQFTAYGEQLKALGV